MDPGRLAAGCRAEAGGDALWVGLGFQGALRSRSLNLAEAPGESGSPGSSGRRWGVSHRRGLCAEGGRGAGAAGTGAAVLSLPPRSHHGVSPARPALSRSHQQMQPLVSGDPDEKSRRDQGSAGPVSPLASPSDSSRHLTRNVTDCMRSGTRGQGAVCSSLCSRSSQETGPGDPPSQGQPARCHLEVGRWSASPSRGGAF